MDRKIPATEVIEQLGRGTDTNMSGGSSGMNSNTNPSSGTRRRSSLFSGAGIMEGAGSDGIYITGQGSQQRRTSLGFGNDGTGGQPFSKLDQHRRTSLDKANEFQQQYAKDGLAESFKSWFRS
ncbi:hypothetical protein Unana1_04617 [Umbelopsis nana]